MDTDVLLQADVAELAKMDLGGYPVAAVEDCSQHFVPFLQKELAWCYHQISDQRAAKDLYIDFEDACCKQWIHLLIPFLWLLQCARNIGLKELSDLGLKRAGGILRDVDYHDQPSSLELPIGPMCGAVA